jgi:hypothetical protein
MTGDPLTCPECGKKHYVIHAEPGELKITGHPVGLVLEGHPENPAGRRLDSSPASGGRSLSTVDGEGGFRIELSGPLERGRPGEWHVLKVLKKVLAAEGHEVLQLSGARDHHGQDALLEIDGERTEVQITSIPQDVWKQLADGKDVVLEGDLDTAVALVRQAVLKMATSGRGVLLAIDAAQVAVFVNSRLVEKYLQRFDDPSQECGYADVWIVGPTTRSTIRLGRGRND